MKVKCKECGHIYTINADPVMEEATPNKKPQGSVKAKKFEKSCEYCNKHFTTHRPHQRFCCHRCAGFATTRGAHAGKESKRVRTYYQRKKSRDYAKAYYQRKKAEKLAKAQTEPRRFFL